MQIACTLCPTTSDLRLSSLWWRTSYNVQPTKHVDKAAKLQVLGMRSDLKLLVMSATLAAARFDQFFNNTALIQIPGRLHPVDRFYSSSTEDYVRAAVRRTCDFHQHQPEGDILVFLTGEDDVLDFCRRVKGRCEELGHKVRVQSASCNDRFIFYCLKQAGTYTEHVMSDLNSCFASCKASSSNVGLNSEKLPKHLISLWAYTKGCEGIAMQSPLHKILQALVRVMKKLDP